MTDLTTLIEKRKEYIKAEAEKIVNRMVVRGTTQTTLATCDAPNWDRELHSAMSEIRHELLAMGIKTTSSVNWGVTDWVFTIKTS